MTRPLCSIAPHVAVSVRTAPTATRRALPGARALHPHNPDGFLTLVSEATDIETED